MKKNILILAVLFSSIACASENTYSSRYANIINEICKDLDIKKEKDGVYKTSDGKCVAIADHMVKDGEKCNTKVQCEVDEMRKARMKRIKEINERDMMILDKISKQIDQGSRNPKVDFCHGFRDEDSELFYADEKGNCRLKAKYKKSRY